MPTFSYHFEGKVKDQKTGIEQEIPGGRALSILGPKIEVDISITDYLGKLLQNQNIKLPKVVSGFALIDTGATHTAIDEGLAQALKLPVIGQENISTPSHQSFEAKVYSHGRISIKNSLVNFDAQRLLGLTLKPQGLQIIFGRDLLSLGMLVYNGKEGYFSFSM